MKNRIFIKSKKISPVRYNIIWWFLPLFFFFGGATHKLESRLLGEISITSDMQMTPPLWQKVKRNSKAS